MQKLLQQDDESEDELEVTDNHSSRQTLLHENPTAELEVIFDNKRSCDAPANTTDYRVSERGNKSADVQDARNRTRPEGSQKENSPRLEQRSASRPIATRRPLDISRQDSQLKEHARPSPSHGVLTEMRPNTGSKQRAFSSMLANELQHETRRSPQSALSSFCFVVTRLPKQFVSLAGYLAKRNGGKMSADVTEETTHVIMPTDSKMHASRNNYTLKYLLGIALGKWIVSQLWITACVKSGRLVDEEQYEVKGDIEAAQSRVPHLARTTRENKSPLLFQSISVVCIGEFSGAISLHQVCQLTRYCGGRVVDFAEEFMKSSNTVSDLIVICGTISEERTEFQIKELCKRYSTFPVSAEWVTDSVANYQLQDIEEYRTDI